MNRPSYWWIVAFGLAWPAGGYAVLGALFPDADPAGTELWGPLIALGLIGVISGFWTVRKLRRRGRSLSRLVVAGAYALGCPVALAFSVLGPQALVAFPGLENFGLWNALLISPLASAVAGSLPLIVAVELGAGIAARRSQSADG